MAKGRSSNRGFTLVDAMMACALLTGGLVVVAGALDGLAAADSATGAKVHARELAVSVLAELKGLHVDAVFHYSPPPDASGQVRVELVNSAGQILALPAQQVDADAFPLRIEARVKAGVKDKRGHVIEVQAIGFITR